MRIVVNRWHKTDLTADEMAKEINAPVAAVLQNDFPVVRRSTIGGNLIGAATRLGREYDAFAKSVMGIQPIPVRRASLLQILTSWI
jgi:hypothetical protein